MRTATLAAMAVLTLSVSAFAAETVPPNVLEEVRQAADAAYKKANPPVPPKTPEQIEARKKAAKSHCESFFARVAERDPDAPAKCG